MGTKKAEITKVTLLDKNDQQNNIFKKNVPLLKGRYFLWIKRLI